MKNIATALFLGFLATSVVNAQTTNLISDHPAVRAAAERYLAEQTTATTSAKSTGARFAMASPVYGGGYQLQSPPVALRLNRIQFSEREVLQASLVVLPAETIEANKEAFTRQKGGESKGSAHFVRERGAIEIISQDPASKKRVFSFLIYGKGHNFTKAVKEYGHSFGLIKITQKPAYKLS